MDTEESEVWRSQLLMLKCEKTTTIANLNAQQYECDPKDTLDIGELCSITGNRKMNGEYPKLEELET